jgi:hypothetical protein
LHDAGTFSFITYREPIAPLKAASRGTIAAAITDSQYHFLKYKLLNSTPPLGTLLSFYSKSLVRAIIPVVTETDQVLSHSQVPNKTTLSRRQNKE